MVPSSTDLRDDAEINLLPLAQFAVLGLSLLWSFVPGFGLIDLDAAIPPGHPLFRDHWFLEGCWGLFVMVLIAGPLVVAVLRPASSPDVWGQLCVLAGCAAVAAVACVAMLSLSLAIGLGINALLIWWLGKAHALSPSSSGRLRRWWPVALTAGAYVGIPTVLFGSEAWTMKTAAMVVVLSGFVGWLAYATARIAPTYVQSRRPSSWPLLVLTVAGAGPWLAYAVSITELYWDGERYEGFAQDRIVAQVVFPLAMVALPALAGWGWIPLRLPVWSTAAASAGFGSLAMLYPAHLASPGATWGAAAAGWSLALVVLTEATARHHSFRRVRHGDRPETGMVARITWSGGFARDPSRRRPEA